MSGPFRVNFALVALVECGQRQPYIPFSSVASDLAVPRHLRGFAPLSHALEKENTPYLEFQRPSTWTKDVRGRDATCRSLAMEPPLRWLAPSSCPSRTRCTPAGPLAVALTRCFVAIVERASRIEALKYVHFAARVVCFVVPHVTASS